MTFETFDQVADMKECKKKTVAHAKQIQEHFRVYSLEGDYAQGKPGDYLMQGVEGELYVCDKNIFEKTYEFTENVYRLAHRAGARQTN